MSISDRIVVMKDGIVQQIGKPQEVYDCPVNLFVAKFLGTPPINVFDGEVRSGKLFIGSEAVMDAAGIEDQPVSIGIRPEGFELSENGSFTCQLSRVEVMGRDITVVCTHDACEAPSVRAIISAKNKVDCTSVRFTLNPDKVLLFRKDSGERIG